MQAKQTFYVFSMNSMSTGKAEHRKPRKLKTASYSSVHVLAYQYKYYSEQSKRRKQNCSQAKQSYTWCNHRSIGEYTRIYSRVKKENRLPLYY